MPLPDAFHDWTRVDVGEGGFYWERFDCEPPPYNTPYQVVRDDWETIGDHEWRIILEYTTSDAG